MCCGCERSAARAAAARKADGDPAYTLVQVSLNDLIMLVLFAPVVTFLVSGASNLTVPFRVLVYSVIAFIVVPLVLGSISRTLLIRAKGGAGSRRSSLRGFTRSPSSPCWRRWS